jgi:Plasmid pRiA4b ORF-3-like protein
MPTPPSPKPVPLRVELREVAPLVWRRVLVSNQWTLAALHKWLQWIMGWMDTHAHEYQVGDGIVAPDWWIHELGYDREETVCRDERRVSVAKVVAELGPRGEFEYRYDMGDGWRLRIVIEAPPDGMIEDIPLPLCIAGENAGPPDDVGGPHAYAEFLAAIADRRDEQHQDMLRWIGGVFDPKGFDLNRLNREWKGTRARRR